MAESSQEALETMIKLLGWKIADAPDKRKPFESKFISLGVEVDVGETSLGRVKVRNKPGRVESIASQVDELVKAGGMRSREAASLLGKVRFAEGQIYGRISAPLTYILSRWSGRAVIRLRSGLGWNVLKSSKPRWPADPGVHKLSKETVSTMLLTVESLQRARPRLLGPPSEAPPELVFIDGACEEEGTSVGGVLVASTGEVECFGFVVHESLVDAWKTKEDQAQVIGQAELFPALVARWVWQGKLRNRRVMFFIDNESARLALVKAYSPVSASLRIIVDCLRWDQEFDCSAWYARVPTFSNLADGPSRLVYTDELRTLGARIVLPKFPDGISQGVASREGKHRTLNYA